MATKTITITKQPSETCLVNFDFSKKMSSLETIVSLDSSVSDPVGITFDGSPTLNAQTVDMLISAGIAPVRDDIAFTPYKLTLIATTSLNQILEIDINLNVQDY